MLKKIVLLWLTLQKVNDSQNYLFFPFFHIGGAETVHLNILGTFKKKPNCFITGKSTSTGNFNKFKALSNLILIDTILESNTLKKLFIKLLSRKINKKHNPVVFGSNSLFFYDLVPYLKNHVYIVDLTHAFSFEKYSPEVYSLKIAHRFSMRIVLGEKTKADYENLYKINGLPNYYKKKLKIIKNYVNVPSKVEKQRSKKLKIIYVARNSEEKRPEIVFEIIENCNERKLGFLFTIVGDFDTSKKLENSIFTGVISNSEVMDKLYNDNDILLLTSEREGLPMVILEGMARKVIPITTNVGEISELKTEEPGIILINSIDTKEIVREFVEKLIELEKNRHAVEVRQENCFHFVKKIYSKEIFTEAYQNLFPN